MQIYFPLISRVAEPYCPDAVFGIGSLATALERCCNASHDTESVQTHTHPLCRIQSVGRCVVCP